MKKIFVSYARTDIEKATRLFDKLKSIRNLDLWFDKHSLLPGVKWRPAIRKAIREADYFLTLVSKQSSTGRGFRNSELSQALEILDEFPPEQIFLVPVRLDDCKMPRDELSELNWVDLFPDWNNGIKKLLSVFKQSKPKGSREFADSETDSDKELTESSRYHYRVGLVDLDLGLTNLSAIAQKLNAIQSFFHFTCPKLPSVEYAVEEIYGIKNLGVYKIQNSFFEDHRYLAVDFVACLTKYSLAFEGKSVILSNRMAGESDEDERFMFISTFKLNTFSREAGCSFEEGIVYLLVGQLVNYFTDIDYHPETRGCVMDFCGTHSDLVIGLKSRKFCDECSKRFPKGKLRQSIEALLSWNLTD